MKLELIRIAKRTNYTIGRLFVNGQYECDTLEPTCRDGGVKIKGKTAIPSGTYRITIDVYSPKFGGESYYKVNANGGRLPRLLNVPDFEGVLIHCGNTAEDTAGCILVGQNKEKGKVLNSRVTFKALYRKMYGAKASNDPIEITIHE